jgi:transposase
VLIKELYGIQVSRHTLGRLYRSHGIVKTKPIVKFYSVMKPAEKQRVQEEFVIRLLNLLQDVDIEVWYFDETTVNLWDYSEKVWMNKKSPVTIQLPRQRGRSVTVLGAISNRRRLVLWQTNTTTDKDTVYDFFKMFVRKKSKRLHTVVVLDNYGAHKTNDLRSLLELNNTELFFLPSSSSPLNAVEVLWAHLKKLWRTNMLKIGRSLEPNEADIFLKELIRKHLLQEGMKLSTAHYSAMKYVLKGGHV